MEAPPPYYDFFVRTVSDLLAKGILTRQMRTLVVCGGETDRDVLVQLGFGDVTITNLDASWTDEDFSPYRRECQDAENLSYPDDSFDLVLVCAGLHHCHSPHRALLEMFRVARHCVLALEARDSILSRIAGRLKVADEYELTAVTDNDFAFGGVSNSPIPNYVYRWTEREVLKTIASYAPYAKPEIHWYHGFAPPVGLLKGRKNSTALMIMYAAYPLLWVLTRIFRKQGNLFAFAIRKPDLSADLFPWLKLDQGSPTVNPEWLEENFKRSG